MPEPIHYLVVIVMLVAGIGGMVGFFVTTILPLFMLFTGKPQPATLEDRVRVRYWDEDYDR